MKKTREVCCACLIILSFGLNLQGIGASFADDGLVYYAATEMQGFQDWAVEQGYDSVSTEVPFVSFSDFSIVFYPTLTMNISNIQIDGFFSNMNTLHTPQLRPYAFKAEIRYVHQAENILFRGQYDATGIAGGESVEAANFALTVQDVQWMYTAQYNLNEDGFLSPKYSRTELLSLTNATSASFDAIAGDEETSIVLKHMVNEQISQILADRLYSSWMVYELDSGIKPAYETYLNTLMTKTSYADIINSKPLG